MSVNVCCICGERTRWWQEKVERSDGLSAHHACIFFYVVEAIDQGKFPSPKVLEEQTTFKEVPN